MTAASTRPGRHPAPGEPARARIKARKSEASRPPASQTPAASRARATPDRRLRGYLYDAAGQDREIPVTPAAVARLHDRTTLWIDLPGRDGAKIRQVGELLELHQDTIRSLDRPGAGLRLYNFGAYLQFAAETVQSRSQDGRIDFVVGRNWVLTVHGGEVGYLQGFRAQDKADTDTGVLSAAALTASLLDWHLEEYFAEVSRVEAAIDELDERILGAPSDEQLLEEILAIRRRSSRLRRTLMAQRSVFYGLSRPDLSQLVDDDASIAFASLASRFERAVDEAEHTRDLSVGSFELFTSRSAQQTNDLVKALTFFTVIIGTTAAVAGLFGMNFDPPFFRSGSVGFFAVTLGLLGLGLAAWVVGRRRRWI